MRILGISAFYHDSAVSLVEEGQVVFAAEEERFSRIKHDNSFPMLTIEACLKQTGLKISDIDAVAYYEKPLLKFERIIDNFVQTYPRSILPFLRSAPEWLSKKIKVEQKIRRSTGFQGQIYFIPHHLSHASAAFYTSPHPNAAILTIDGVGEYQTTALWKGSGNKITPLYEINFPHSLGLLYSTFTAYLGFRVNDDEYKVMGMAAYGKPRFTAKIKQIVDIKPDGSFKLDQKYFSYRDEFRMWSRDFENLFGPQHQTGQKFSQKHFDLAASIQNVTEEIYFKMLNFLYEKTGLSTVCIGGGVALNALANGKLYKNTSFKNCYIFGPSGDSGAASGAALFIHHNVMGKTKRLPIADLRLGTLFTDQDIEKALQDSGLKSRKFSSECELVDQVAELLAKNNIIGWFQGKMEYGPRALGSRSILANPSQPWMKDRVNEVKFREEFRPFAGSVLQDFVDDYFEVPGKNHSSPFMTFCFQVKPAKKRDLAAITHEDGSCRIQTVTKKDRLYYSLIKNFGDKTGVYCLLNTSFNLKGEPIVENPTQAINDLMRSELDLLVLGKFLVTKTARKE